MENVLSDEAAVDGTVQISDSMLTTSPNMTLVPGGISVSLRSTSAVPVGFSENDADSTLSSCESFFHVDARGDPEIIKACFWV